jgi:hypothetical protein
MARRVPKYQKYVGAPASLLHARGEGAQRADEVFFQVTNSGVVSSLCKVPTVDGSATPSTFVCRKCI